jgi:DNA repair exonuclease SbcCD ATPase subunit
MMLRHAREHRAQSIIANVSAIARNPEQFLATLAETFGLDLNVHAPSPFEGELMHTIARDAPQATLLRHLVPEIDRLYSSLEREADIPSGTSEGKRASARRVKSAFFNGWLLESKREDELNLRNADLTLRNAELNQGDAELNLRNAELNLRNAELNQRNAELNQRNAAVEQRDAELAGTRAVLYELQASYAKRGEHLDEAERLLRVERAAREAELESVRNEVERAENRVRDALAQDADLRTTIADLRTTIADLRTTIADLRTTIADLEAQLENARTRNQDLEQRLEQTTRELLKQTEALIAATRAESDRVAFLIATVQSSSFWKIKRGINRVLRSLGLRAQQ